MFLDHLRYDRNCSSGTLQKYGSNLRIFLADLGNLDATALRPEDLTAWKRALSERALGAARIANLVFTVRALFRFCLEYLELDVLDPHKVTIPKAPQKLPEVLTPEEQVRFFMAVRRDCITGDRYALRFLALVLCLRGTGARIGELLQLNRSDIDFETREAKIVGKGDKERMLYFPAEALAALKEYLASRRDDREALFVSQGEPRRWRQANAQKYFHRYAARAGLSKRVTAHMFRRIFCTTLHRNGADLLTIKELAGHADIKTTMQYYIARDAHHLKGQAEKYLRF